MSFYFRDEVLPFYGGGTAAGARVQGERFHVLGSHAPRLRAWRAHLRLRAQQARHRLLRFKEHWGFEPAPLHYQYYLVRAKELPNVSPANPKYRMFIRAWQRLPLPVSRALGPLLARSLG